MGRQFFPGRMRVGYGDVHLAVDDASRLVLPGMGRSRVLPDQRGSTAAQFLLGAAQCFADHGIQIERVLTDWAFASTQAYAFRDAVTSLGARHQLTRPSHPQTNGKTERFIRTLLEEWAYARLYRANAERLAALPGWLAF